MNNRNDMTGVAILIAGTEERQRMIVQHGEAMDRFLFVVTDAEGREIFGKDITSDEAQTIVKKSNERHARYIDSDEYKAKQEAFWTKKAKMYRAEEREALVMSKIIEQNNYEEYLHYKYEQ